MGKASLVGVAFLALGAACDRPVAGDLDAAADARAPHLTRATAERPNVILLVADDLGYFDVGAYGNDFVETPNLDRMAAEGLRFTESYASGAVCSPSRVAIQTGKTPARLGITEHFHGPTQPQPWMRVIPPDNEPNLAASHSTLAKSLRRRDYDRRLHVGKWHAGGNGPLVHGYSEVYGGNAGYRLNATYHHPYWPDVDPAADNPYAEVIRDSEPGDYLTDVLTDRVLREVTEATAAGEEFFVHLDFYAPHVPIDGKAELVTKYTAKKAAYSGDYDLDPQYAAMVETIDANVGRLLDTLAALGIAENTVVLFTSDNGGLADRENPPFDPFTPATDNGELRAGKGHLYEGGTRVPTIVWGGPVPGGRTSDALHVGHDIYPSLLELATGTGPEAEVDGVSHAATYLGAEAGDPDRAVLWHYPHYSNQGGVPRSSLRQGRYKVIYDYGDSTLQVYNLRGDLAEDVDLAMCSGRVGDSLLVMLREGLAEQGAKLPAVNPNYDGE